MKKMSLSGAGSAPFLVTPSRVSVLPYRALSFGLALSVPLLFPLATQAADITYNDGGVGSPALVNDPLNTGLPVLDSLVPVDPSSNALTVTGAATNPIAGSVYGGYDATGAVTGNTVIIDSSVANTTVGKDVIGGYSGSGAVSTNSVTVKSSDLINTTTVTGNVVGGKSATGTVSGSLVTVLGGAVGGDVTGAWIHDFATATSETSGTNAVILSGGTVGGGVIAARNDGTGAVSGTNTATVSGGTVGRGVVGAVSSSGAISGTNTAEVSGGTVTGGLVPGSLLSGAVIGAASVDGTVSGTNTATVSDGAVTGDVIGAASRYGSVHGLNTATVSGGTVTGDVIGGDSFGGTVTGSHAKISGGTVTGDVTGGHNFDGSVTGAKATISGGTVTGNVRGGYASGGGDVTNNTVLLTDGTVSGNVIGGVVDTGKATHNTVTVGKRFTGFAATANLLGGQATGAAPDAFTGNTLNLLGGTHTVGSVANFQTYNFTLPATASVTPLLTAGTIELTDGGTRTATVGLMVERGSRLAVGTDYTLMAATSSLTGTYDATTVRARRGIGAAYDVWVEQVGDSLVATVASAPTGTEEGKALMEGRAGALGFVNQGSDMVAGQGMASALAATSGAPGVAGFGALGGGSSRYDSGSHVDVDGASLMAGLGWRAPVDQNALLLGTFFEAGWGSYDTYNAFNIRGSGDTSYYGGGVLARYDLTEGSAAGLYTEASARAGRVSTDFASDDLLAGEHTSYDSAATYVGAHAGLGYIWRLNDQASLDLSTKYLWTHQGSDTVTVAGEDVRFDGSDSHRWRNGARFSYAVTTETGAQFTPYIGGAYDHEFDGKAKGSVGGVDQNAPSLAGGTGVGELGVTFKPVSTSGLSADLGVQGYVGMREGVTGSLQVKYTF